MTGTATFHPLFPTSTEGPGLFECPGGVPVGYGTVTPDPGWLALCSRCLPTSTPYAMPTGTLAPIHMTLTALAEGTGTPFPTATLAPSPTSTPSADGHSLKLTLLDPLAIGDGIETSDTLFQSVPLNGTSDTIYISRFYSGVTHEYWNPGGRTSAIDYRVQNVSGQPVTLYISFRGSASHAFPVSFTVNNKPEMTGTAPYEVTNFYWGILGNNEVAMGGLGIRQLNIGRSVPFSHQEYLTFSVMPVSLYTPTPQAATPTPSVSGYCSVVDGTGEEEGSGFELPVITGGEPICRGAGGFIIPFSWFQIIGFQLDDLIVPQINMCFVPTSFGTLTIAYNEINLDVAAYILGALLLFSFVRK